MKAGLAFWLRVVEARGGLAEQAGDAALVMLPPSLQTFFDLPADLEVTDDPDVAREDGITFVGAGHPAIARAADALLADADVGVIQLAPAGHVPDLGTLQDKARLRFPVAHGRIDIAEPGRPVSVVILRMGALVRYALSEEDHYQEALEQLIDVTTCLPVQSAVASKLLSAPRAPEDPAAAAVDVSEAVLTAYREIDAAASRRRTELAKDVAGACRDELARAESYYAAALESIAKRRANAPPDRQALLDARAESTRGERARRLEEIADKYRGAHEVQPYRLHLLHVPALRLDAEVRRGERRYPLSLTWLPVAAEFAGVRCPACRRHAPLDAGKTELGCIACHAKAPVVPPPRPPAPVPSATGNGGRPAPTEPAGNDARTRHNPPAPRTAANDRPKATAARGAKPTAGAAGPVAQTPARTKVLTGKALETAGGKVAVALWQANVDGDNRAMKRLAAAQSPMSTAYRLFRSLAPAVCVGLPAGTTPQGLNSWSAAHAAPGHYVTVGEIITGARQYSCTILWRETAAGRQIVQVSPRMTGLLGLPFGLGSLRQMLGAPLFEQCPPPAEPLDEVAAALWQTATPRLGVPIAVRALTSWWRLPDPEALYPRFPNRVIAAALERATCYWGGDGPGGYEAAAATYGVPVEDVRKVGASLQKTLKLSSDLPW